MFQERKRWELGGVYLSFIDQKLLSQLPFALDRFESIVYLSTRGTGLGGRRGGPSRAL